MIPEIGEIFDCRNVPEVGHFVLTLGERNKRGKNEVMYYIITSRVYAVFTHITDFFNDCLSRKDKRFSIYFPKEKNKDKITMHGRLKDAFFLDTESDYKGCLDVDSMIVVNESPKLADTEIFERWHKGGLAVHRNRLTKEDTMKFIDVIKCSTEISEESRIHICRNYNIYRKSKAQKAERT